MCVVLDVPGMLPGEVTNETHYGHHRIPKGGWKRETRDIHQGIILFAILVTPQHTLRPPSRLIPSLPTPSASHESQS